MEVLAVKVSDVVFRSDLYPRLETSAATVQKYAEDLDVLPPIEVNQRNELIDGWHRWTADGVEVSFAFAFPDVCPPSLASLAAGLVRGGIFYPYGSVSHYYADLQTSHRQSTPPPAPDVYFVQSEKGGPVKIGVAKDVGRRIESLQTAHPCRLVLLGIIPQGGRRIERLLHARFARQRLLGEWFECSQELMEVIR